MVGLSALQAQMLAEPLCKAWDESRVSRDAHGRFTGSAKSSALPLAALKSDDDQSANVVDLYKRKVVVVEAGGDRVPFYLSTGYGGKKDVEPGRWYPFAGVSPRVRGWFNKTSGLGDYYGSPALRELGRRLDAQLGDVRDEAHPVVSDLQGVGVAEINRGMTPLGESGHVSLEAGTEALKASADRVLASLSEPMSKSEVAPGVFRSVTQQMSGGDRTLLRHRLGTEDSPARAAQRTKIMSPEAAKAQNERLSAANRVSTPSGPLRLSTQTHASLRANPDVTHHGGSLYSLKSDRSAGVAAEMVRSKRINVGSKPVVVGSHGSKTAVPSLVGESMSGLAQVTRTGGKSAPRVMAFGTGWKRLPESRQVTVAAHEAAHSRAKRGYWHQIRRNGTQRAMEEARADVAATQKAGMPKNFGYASKEGLLGGSKAWSMDYLKHRKSLQASTGVAAPKVPLGTRLRLLARRA